jgi:hypothetical protein
MKRRQVLMLMGGTTVSTVVLATAAPPAQALFPLLLRIIAGQAVRRSLKKMALEKSAQGRSARRPRAGYRGSTLKSRRSGLRRAKSG